MKEIFYKNADSYLIKTKNISNNNDDFIHLNLNEKSDENSGEKWLKNFTENMIKNFSCKNRDNIKQQTNNSNIRFLIELEDYIKKYIIDFDYSCKVVGNKNINKSLNATNNLTNVEQQSNLDKSYERIEKILDNVLDKFLDIKYQNNEFIKNIGDFTEEKGNLKIKEQIDQYKKINISLNEKIFESLSNELNDYNYDIGDSRNKNLINLDFKNNNYIYYKKNNEDDIKLINIKQQEYKDILKSGGLTNQNNFIVNDLLTKYPDSSYNIIKCALLSIRNRFQLINKNLETNIFAFESYITRGTLFYYKTILDAIKSKIKKNEGNIYLPILFSVFFYQILFDKLYNKIIDEEVINFKLLDDYMFSNQTTQKTNTLNSFASLFYIEIKPFLDQYKAADSEQKVKLFCNINDNYGAIKKYNTNNNVKDNITNLIGKNYKQNGNGNGNDNNTKVDKRVFTIKNEKSKYDILQIITDIDIKKNNSGPDNCKPFKLNFNKIFDGTNPQVMAPYMAASNVINNYEGLMLFTFGYSGVGKSFTVFGGDNIKGVLPSIINSIQNVNSVDVKIYEIYGMGLNINNDYFNNNKYFKYISYQLNDEIDIDKNSINIIDSLENIQSKTLEKNNLNKFLKNLNKDKGINDNIEEIRGKINDNIKYSTGKINDDGINIKTIKKTKNNPDSSRSILCYELIINKDGQKIPFIICDLPGKEKIIDSFGKEGEGLLKINNNNEINDKFLNEHFGNILENIKKLTVDETNKIFEDIDITDNEIKEKKINVGYTILKDEAGTNLNFRLTKKGLIKYKIDIIKENINIESNNNDIKNLIYYIPNLLILKQKKSDSKHEQVLLANNNDHTFENELYLGISKDYKEFINEIDENEYNNKDNTIKFKLQLNNFYDFKPYFNYTVLILDNLKEDINKKINQNQKTISYFRISIDNFTNLKQISNIELNKIKLIKAMNTAINYGQNNEIELKQHPVLKLTQILDEINDNKYIGDYLNNAEKCFRYTKAAEGIFINENINGIIQLLSDKKGLSNSNNNNQNNNDYKEENMYYNEKNNTNNSFNNTIIYEKLYDIYEKKTNNNASNSDKLRKIDNMYAFFVVANISKNERIKQKLICNATKTSKGYKTEQELGWVCDQEEVDKKNKEKEEKKQKDKKEKIEKIKKIIENTLTEKIKNKKDYFKVLISGKQKNLYRFFINIKENTKSLNINIDIDKTKAEELLTNMSNIFNKKKSLEKLKEEELKNLKEEYIEYLTNKLYDEYMVKDNTNTIEEEISSSINNNEIDRNNLKRELYIREMCKTQIALFKELEDKINQINKSEE